LRTAEAAGVDGVLIPERRTCGVTPAVVQASAGAALHLRISRVGNLVQALERAKSRGFWVAGLDMQGQHRPEDVAQGQPLVVVIGGEHHGVRRLVREHCDFLVSLPMRGRVPSLNLSVATGILLYQLTRHVEVQAPVSSDGAATGPSRAWAGGPRKSTSRAVKPSNGRS
jgi:23S rRNA (guanosine2251-2'-O)-methyltransferase